MLHFEIGIVTNLEMKDSFFYTSPSSSFQSQSINSVSSNNHSTCGFQYKTENAVTLTEHSTLPSIFNSQNNQETAIESDIDIFSVKKRKREEVDCNGASKQQKILFCNTQEETFQIFIRNLKGRHITIDVKYNDTLQSVKKVSLSHSYIAECNTQPSESAREGVDTN